MVASTFILTEMKQSKLLKCFTINTNKINEALVNSASNGYNEYLDMYKT